MTHRQSQQSTTVSLWPHQIVIDRKGGVDPEKSIEMQVAGYRLVCFLEQALSFTWVLGIANSVGKIRNATNHDSITSKNTAWRKPS